MNKEEVLPHGHDAVQRCTAEKTPASGLKKTEHGRGASVGRSVAMPKGTIAPFTTARADIPEGANLPVYSLLGNESRREVVPPHVHEAFRPRGEV